MVSGKRPAAVDVDSIEKARERLRSVVRHTPLEYNEQLSERYQCHIWLKREDLQYGRSYKIRGAYNFMRSTPKEELQDGVVAASAGNHAQGVAIGCTNLEVKGTIYMPKTTPQQKVEKVKKYGGQFVEVVLSGDTFDDAYAEACKFADKQAKLFIHPFNDPRIIQGQGTIAAEILEDATEPIDYVFTALGGGGMTAGVGSYFKKVSPYTKIIATEPEGAPSMREALKAGQPVQLERIDKFVDGASVGKVGDLTFKICQKLLSEVVLVPEGKACTTILEMYNQDAMVVEPAGALPIAALDYKKEAIQGKNVVCIIGGSNNDIERMAEIKERSLIYEGLLHYFVINLPSRPGSMAEFLMNVITPEIDIIKIEHEKKSNKDTGACLLGVQVKDRQQYEDLLQRIVEAPNISHTLIDKNPDLYYYFLG